MSQDGQHRVVLEIGRTWVFASALDWPGWCRRGKGEHEALEALADYVDRYAAVAGAEFSAADLNVVERLEGSATTDFGAPSAVSAFEVEPLEAVDVERFLRLLNAAWRYFDDAVAKAPEQLAKGPRGGGRDRDAIVAHVREAERSGAAKLAVRLSPRTAWNEQRDAIRRALAAARPDTRWPLRYAVRRITWHVLDHAWEIEDKSR